MTSVKSTNGYWILLLLLIPISIYFIASFLQTSDYPKIKKAGGQTKGILFEKGADALKIRYYVNGKEYIYGGNEPYEHLQEGEEYIIEYEIADPTNIYVDYNRPIMGNEYHFLETKCLSLSYLADIGTFTYEVKGVIHMRNFYFEKGQTLNLNSYSVKYRQDAPAIGYLFKRNQ